MQARGFLDADPTDSVQHGMPNGHIPGLNVRLSSYITVLVEEWLLACVVWRAMRDRGVPLASLVGGSWRTPGALVRDIGLAMAFTVLVVPLGSSLMYSIGGNGAVLIDLVPHTGFELALWLMLSASAGFCEELIFRGYMKQMGDWGGSRLTAVLLQGVAFGLAHGYYGRGTVVIMIHGCLLGGLAQWRRSPRPGMLAHGLQEGFAGTVGFFLTR